METADTEGGKGAEDRRCRNNCGFFGSDATCGLCSKCWKEKIAEDEVKAKCQTKGAAGTAPCNDSLTSVDEMYKASVASDTMSDSNSLTLVKPDAQECCEFDIDSRTRPDTEINEQEPDESTNISIHQPNRRRCFTCNKKIGLLGIECRCKLIFCSLHRYPDAHDCTYDFKTNGREHLRKHLPGGGEFSKLDKV
eukprot:113969_1